VTGYEVLLREQPDFAWSIYAPRPTKPARLAGWHATPASMSG
jgi:hypothetical protein